MAKINESLFDRNKETIELRKKLLEFGYKHIVFCEIEDRGLFSISHYYLSKEEKVQNDGSCLLFLTIPLETEEALLLLQKMMNQKVITPDISSINLDSDNNEDPLIRQQTTQEQHKIKFQNEKVYAQRARQLQKKLIEKGYKTLEFCDETDDGIVFSSHYNLSKDDEIAKPDSCILYTRIPIDSDRAYNVIRSWVCQTVIHTDLRTI